MSMNAGIEPTGPRKPRSAGKVAAKPNGKHTHAAASQHLSGRQLLQALSALKRGDFTRRLPGDLTGLDGKIADAFNDAIELNARLAGELRRLARVVGAEGRISQRASLGDVSGGWAASVEAVNSVISDLVSPVRETARVIGAVARGDLSQTMALETEDRPLKGEFLRTAKTVNTMVDQLSSFASEVTRVAREVGTEGKLGGQAAVQGAAGTWKDLTDSVNLMAGNLTAQVRNIAEVTTAVANGDLSKKITVDVKGEILDLKNTVNTMVDQLSSFASEVTRVAREVGTEGKLGGQAVVKGVSGTWKDLTDNVNSMAGNLTSQVRGIAKVVTAVAQGDLKRNFTVEAKGEIAELADTINGMIETLAIFADQVTTVAREVGVEGQLGGQASVPGAAGVWKDLTENVNQLAANLTTQMRAIAEVATAVTTGDLTRSITVEAEGEVAALRDNINEMIRHLRDTTQKNSEQDWLKTNLAKFSRMLQGQKDLLTVGRLILSELAPVVSAQHAVFYILDSTGEEPELQLLASYAHRERSAMGNHFRLGEGLVGQAAIEKQKILLMEIPTDYIRISSGLGEAVPLNVIVLPVVFEGNVKAVLELASFERFNTTHQAFLDQLAETIGIVLNTIEANTRTEDLLKQSQSLATELQNQQEELRQTNQQLEDKAGLLAQQNLEVERKNAEIEQARQALEEKAEQLTVTSRYKTEFLANMSHELRTPLNSLLILSDQLSRNPDGNLTKRQTEFAKTIHASGTDLLALINDILDLSKIESGTVVVDVSELRFTDLRLFVERTFQHVADAKNLRFSLDFAPELPRALHTDSKRLQQVVKNLLSNAFKFTERGNVSLSVRVAHGGWNPENETLNRAGTVVALAVRDTGIGIPTAKHQIIFEAFQQADGSTSRRYGGTGLGLAISREIAQLLGGDIRVESTPSEGSTFTLYLPQVYVAPPKTQRTPLPALQAHVAPPAPALAPGAADQAVTPLLEPPRDDRGTLAPGDRVLLIVDNDEGFTDFLLEVAHENGWKGIVAGSGAAAVALAHECNPDAMTLDIRLPDVDGLRVLRRFKSDLALRHIPVHIISTADEGARAGALGAWTVLSKPIQTREVLDAALLSLREYVEREQRDLLIVTDRDAEIGQLIDGCDAKRHWARDPEQAVGLADHVPLACALVDGRAVGERALPLARELRTCPRGATLPVVIYALAQGPGAEERQRLRQEQVFVVDTPEQLLERTTALLHQPIATLPPARRALLEDLQRAPVILASRKALIVDDDVRNIFAMTSVLEKEDMQVVAAENGQAAIELLQQNPDIDVVLMDIMMPGMDGYETMRAIRKMPQFRWLPIIAVTAKAMKGDRERTIEAGAWDYISKPVEPDHMLSVLRAWLHQ